MKPRILILPISAAVILAMVMWRVSREPEQSDGPAAPAAMRRLAPAFELYDQHSQLVKFERYLGRTRLLLLFIGDRPASEHPLARQLLDHHAAIESAGIQIVVVGVATPFANRESEKQLGARFPFPVLTDVNLRSPEPVPVHRQWGLVGDGPSAQAEVREGLFLIGRDGTVDWSRTAPQPVADPVAIVGSIAVGEWPE